MDENLAFPRLWNNLSTVKFSIVVDKHNLERINNEYKIKKEF